MLKRRTQKKTKQRANPLHPDLMRWAAHFFGWNRSDWQGNTIRALNQSLLSWPQCPSKKTRKAARKTIDIGMETNLHQQTIAVVGPLFENKESRSQAVSNVSSSQSIDAPKRIQELFRLLKDIQNDTNVRNKNQAQQIIEGIRKRLLSARDDSATLVFSGKLAGGSSGGPEFTLNQTLNSIESDLLALRDDERIVQQEFETVVGKEELKPIQNRAVEERTNESSSSGDQSEDSETSTDSSDENDAGMMAATKQCKETTPVPESPLSCVDGKLGDGHVEEQTTSSSTTVVNAVVLLEKERKRNAHLEYLNRTLESKVQTIEAQKLKLKEQLENDSEKAVRSESTTPTDGNCHKGVEKTASAREEELEGCLTAERKRIAHLEYLNRTLESKVQKIEAQKVEMSRQLENSATIRHDSATANVGSANVPKKTNLLEEQLEQSVSSLAIFKAEAANMHQEILQLRKKVELLTQEASRKESAEARLKTLNRELEQQTTLMIQEQGRLKKALEVETSQRKVPKAELDKAGKVNKALKQQLKKQESSHAVEMEEVTSKLQSSKNDVAQLQKEIAIHKEEAEAAVSELSRSNALLEQDCNAKAQEIQELKDTIHLQQISVNTAKADYETLESDLRNIIMQQRNDLRARDEALQAEITKNHDALDAAKREYEKKLQTELKRHGEKMAEREERHLKETRIQLSSMKVKQDEIQQLLEQSRELNTILETKLQKSRSDNARCLALVVKLGGNKLAGIDN